MTPDSKLLRKYVEKHDEAAFAEVVRRHVNLVYGAALRQMKGETAQAEDVAQDTFTELVRKAPELCDRATVAGWLHTTARFLAMRSQRRDQRRRAREQEALAMSNPANRKEISWEQLRPVLDEAVALLDDRDRDAVLLRFFEEKSHREVGDILGLSENAARMRVERALEKLRSHFSKRGLTTTAALLAAIFGAHGTTPAPAAFAASVAGKSLAGAAKKTSGKGMGILALLAMKTWRGRLTASVAALLALLISWQVWEKFSSNPPVMVAPVKESTPPPTAAADDPDTPRATEPQWDEVRDFSEGLAAVALNVEGNSTSTIGSPGRAPVATPKLWGFIDTTGKVVVQPQFDSVNDFSDGLAWVKFGAVVECIDKTGQAVFQSQWDNAFDFSEGVAWVLVGRKWGFIDKTGKVVIEPQWNQALRFSEGVAAVGNMTDITRGVGSIEWSFIDEAGKVVVELPDGVSAMMVISGGNALASKKGYGIFQDGVAIINVPLPSDPGHSSLGWIDKTGKIVLDPLDPGTPYFSDGLLIGYVSRRTAGPVPAPGEVPDYKPYLGLQMGYVDKNGRIVIEAKQDALANNFSEGLAAVWSEDGTSYIDKTGKVVIEVPRPHGGPFSEGLAAILEEGKCFGYIDKTGKVVIELPSDYTGADFIGGFARVSRRDADGQTKWGFIDKTGKLIGPPNNDPNPPSPEP